MAAQNVGAGKWHRVNRIAGIGVMYGIAITGSVIIVLELLGAPAFSPFLPAGSAALAIAAHLNLIATPSYMFFAIAMILFATVRSTGAVMLPLAIMTVSLLLVRFPLADALLSRYQADAIWWSFPSPRRWRRSSARCTSSSAAGARRAWCREISPPRARAPSLWAGSTARPRETADFAVLVEDRGSRGVLASAAPLQRPADDGTALADMHQAIDVHGDLAEEHHAIVGAYGVEAGAIERR